MRKASYVNPVWPYIGAVVCLFVLTLLAPFTWRNVVTHPGQWRMESGRSVVALNSKAIGPSEVANAIPTASVSSQADALIAVFPAPTKVETRVWNVPSAANNTTVEPIDLSAFQAPRQPAITAPPIADRIEVAARSVEQPTVPVPAEKPITPPAKRLASTSSVSRTPEIPQKKARDFGKTPHSWPKAVALIEEFRGLQHFAETRAWADHAIATLEAIQHLDSLNVPASTRALDGLSQVAKQGIVLAKSTPSHEMRSRIIRAGYATVRRELLWRQIHQISSNATAGVPQVSIREAGLRLEAVRAKIGDSEHAAAWRKYLLLDEIQTNLQRADVAKRAALARKVLARMTSPKLTSAQRTVLQQHPFSALQAELRRWVVEPINYPQLLADIELYEQSRSADAAHRIAASFQVVRWSDNQDLAKLAKFLDTHYRNANLRVAVRDDLLNRLLPQQDDFEEQVNEHIIGAQVLGNVQGSAHMRTVLIPDQRRWRFGLQVEGEVESQTAATRGPATFFNDGYSRYQARKLFQVDRRGVLVSDSEAEANTNSELTGFRTLFDSLPVIGWLARGIARQQHDDQTEMARWVSETRLESRMRERLDSEVQTQLEAAEIKIEQKIITPLKRLDLNPDALEMRTTEQRLIARYRLAADNHLGAFTPRPQAPSDSMLSVQVHETMLNNTLEQLGLDGRRTKLRQLYRDLADAFDRTDLEVPEDIPENVTLQFADVNPVKVYCEDGKMTLTLQIAELKNRRNSWQHFEVRAEYVPDDTHLHAHLVRDGVIQLIGDRLSFIDQVALRTIFSRALSKNQPFNIITTKLAESPAIADLSVNQFVIEDGWIGVALGPNRVATRRDPAPVVNVIR